MHIPSLPLTHSWAHKHWAGKSMPVTGRPARRRVTHAENAPEGKLRELDIGLGHEMGEEVNTAGVLRDTI